MPRFMLIPVDRFLLRLLLLLRVLLLLWARPLDHRETALSFIVSWFFANSIGIFVRSFLRTARL